MCGRANSSRAGHPLGMKQLIQSTLQHRSFPCAPALLAALVLGCGVDAETERLGYTDDRLTATPPASDARPLDFLGRWRGRATDELEPPGADGAAPYLFPSGSSDVTLELFADSGVLLDGTLVFGSAPPPEATDPMASYPPGTAFEDYDSAPAALEGATYHLSFSPLASEIAPENRYPDGSFESGLEVSLADADGILRLRYSTAGMYADWCALQPALPNPAEGPGAFNCLGAAGVA